MPTGKLTVIIPTYNRKAILKRVLQGYLHQSIASDSFEVLIIDDGSTDGTAQAVASISENSAIALRYHRQENKGPAAARNVGIREARGEVILFADDDIIPASDLIAEHWTWHRKHPEPNVAVLGYVTWAADVNATPFMKWYGEEGPLLAYKQFVGREELDFRFFYTSNLSLKSEFLRKNGTFDEEFKSAAFEDTELGYRLQKRGMRLLHNRSAIGYHYQRFSFGDACARAQRVAVAATILYQKEAGIYLAELASRNRAGSLRRTGKLIAARLIPVLGPLRGLLDSRIPLPSIIYRSFFWYYVSRPEIAYGGDVR